MIERCAYQFKLRYIEGRKVPPDLPLLRGDAVHKGQEHNYTQRFDTGSPVSEAEVVDVTADAFEQAVKTREYGLGSYGRHGSPKQARGRAKQDALACAKAYHKVIGSRLRVAEVKGEPGVELQITVDSPRFRLPLLGIIDLVEDAPLRQIALVDGEPSEKRVHRIRDTKTVSRSMRPADVDNDLQPTFYEILYRATTGHAPAGHVFDTVVLSKDGSATVQPIPTARGPAELEGLVQRVEASLKMVEAETFIPCNPTSWACSQSFCGFWESVCPFGKRARSNRPRS